MHGRQTFSIDYAAGVCRIFGEGVWTPADARAHFDEIEKALRPLRSAGKQVIFLIDMRNAVVQPLETARTTSSGANRLHDETDIVAVITGTVLHALQIKAFSRVTNIETFHDVGPAMDWAQARRRAA